MRTSLVIVISTWLLCAAASAGAQDAPRAAVLRTSGGGDAAGAYDRLLRERMQSLEAARIEAGVELDLEQVQLALGCMGETAQCLGAVASELHVDLVISPSLAEVDGEWMAAATLFDARTNEVRRAVRRGPSAASLLGSAESLLRELFGLPPAATGSHDAGEGTGSAAPPAPGVSPAPIVLIAVGGAALIAGAISAGLGAADAGAYTSAAPMTSAEVDRAEATLSRAQTEYLVGDILLAGGAALAIGGVVWLLAAGREDGSSLALVPSVGPTTAGLAVSGGF